MKRVLIQLSQDFKAYRMRFLLVIFGVAWGTTAIVLNMAFGVGVMLQVKKGLQGLGEHIGILWPGQTSVPYKGLGIGRNIRFVPEDAELLKERIDIIEKASPEYIHSNRPIKYGEVLRNAKVCGVNPSYGMMRSIDAGKGRFLNKLDVEQRRRVIFLGDEEKEKIFGAEDAVGKRILLNGIPFTVIGVMKKKIQHNCYSGNDQNAVFIPYSTFKTMYGWLYISDMVYKPISPDLSKKAQEEISRVLGEKYKFDPEDKEALGTWDVAESEKMMDKMTKGIEIFLSIVGAMTLLIAGAAIANIMYFIVDERTREIGIKRSVGATKSDILRQFLLESLLLSAIGGTVGLLFSFLLVWLCSFIPEVGIFEFIGKPTLSAEIPVTTVIVLLVISVFSGYFPAKKAANLRPVECLRYE
jgi:putative ABC transport system permease protein